MPSKTAKKRPGPTPRGEYSGTSAVLSTRITPELRSQLEKASKQSGRTLSQEIENRLRQTFTDEQKLSDQFGDYRTALILRLVASHLNGMRNPENPEAHWLDDPRAFAFGMDVLFWTLDTVRPKEPPDAEKLERTRDFDRPEGAFHRALSAAELTRRAWRQVAETDRAFPPPHVRMTDKQRLAHLVKNKIPEIVERSETDIFGAQPEPEQPLPTPEPPPPYSTENFEEQNQLRRENYYCAYCDDFYPKDQGLQCPTCKGHDLSGRKHGGDGRQLELLSQTELKRGDE